MDEELLKQLERGTVDLEPLFVMAYHDFIRSNKFDIYEKLIFLDLKSYSGKHNSCFPGQEIICKDLGISVRKLRDTLKSLENKGAILSIPMYTETNRRTSNRYILAKFDHDTKTFDSNSLDKYREFKKTGIKVKGY